MNLKKKYAEKKSQTQKIPYLYDSIYGRYPEQVNPQTKCRMGVARGSGSRRWNTAAFGVMFAGRVAHVQPCECTKATQLRAVIFLFCHVTKKVLKLIQLQPPPLWPALRPLTGRSVKIPSLQSVGISEQQAQTKQPMSPSIPNQFLKSHKSPPLNLLIDHLLASVKRK